MKKRSVVVSETYERVLYQVNAPMVRFRCLLCLSEVNWLSTGDAMRYYGPSERTIHRMIDAGTLHFCETKDGAVMICEQSLADIFTGQ